MPLPDPPAAAAAAVWPVPPLLRLPADEVGRQSHRLVPIEVDMGPQPPTGLDIKPTVVAVATMKTMMVLRTKHLPPTKYWTPRRCR